MILKSLIFTTVLTIVLMFVYDSYKFKQYKREFHSKIKPGTRLKQIITDVSDESDVVEFNINIIERISENTVLVEWSRDKSQTYMSIESLINYWKIVD